MTLSRCVALSVSLTWKASPSQVLVAEQRQARAELLSLGFELLEKKERREQDEAASKIQAMHRGNLERKKLQGAEPMPRKKLESKVFTDTEVKF